MGVFCRRPFALSLFCLILSFFLVYALTVSDILSVSPKLSYTVFFGFIILAALLCAVFVVFAVRIPRLRIRLVSLSIAMLFTVLGLLRAGGYFFDFYAPAQEFIGETVTVTAKIKERESSSAGFSRYRVTVRAIGEQEEAEPFDAALVIDAAGEYAVGDCIAFEAEGCALSEIYAYPAYAIADGCLIGLLCENSAEKITLLTEDDREPSRWDRLTFFARTLRNRLSFRLSESLGGEVGAFASAVLLGDRTGLSESTVRDFGRAGISHLLALSGLHMSILIGGLALLLRRCGLPRRAVSLLTLLAIFAFLLLTGFSMSACRAGLMLGFAALLGFFSRSPDVFTSLFLSVSVVLLVMPSAIASVGLWMSFASVLGLLVFAPHLNARFYTPKREKTGIRYGFVRLFRAVMISFGISLIASFSILPVLYLSGGEFSLIGVLTNLLTVCLMPTFLVLSLVFLLFGRVVLVGSAAGMLLRVIGGWILSVARGISRIPNATVSLSYSFVGVCVFVFVLPTVLLLCLPPQFFLRIRKIFRRRSGQKAPETNDEKPREIRARWFILPPAVATIFYVCCLLVHLSAFAAADTLPVSVISVSGGELLTVTDGTSAVLVDLSEGYYSSYSAAVTESGRNGCTEWSRVVLTQYRFRHLSSVPLFCRSNLVREVLLPTPVSDREMLYMEGLVERLLYYGIPYRFYERGEEIAVTDSLDMMLSDAVYLERSVQPIFSLTLSGKEKLVYFTQSVEESEYKDIAMSLAADSEFLIYGSRGPIRKATFTPPVPNGRTRGVLLYGDENRKRLRLGDTDMEQVAFERVIFEYDKEVVRLWENTAS